MPRTRQPRIDRPPRLSPRQRIVAGARRHFLTHGFRGVTMDDLAAELGMSKKTLYAHFRSKNALVEAVLLDKARHLEADLGRIEAESARDFGAALGAMLICLRGHTEEIQPSFVRDMKRAIPDLFKIIETRRAALIQRYFGKLFQDGRRNGMVRKDLPPRLAIEVLLGSIQAVANPPKLIELGLTPQAALPAIISVILQGILTPAARKKR